MLTFTKIDSSWYLKKCFSVIKGWAWLRKHSIAREELSINTTEISQWQWKYTPKMTACIYLENSTVLRKPRAPKYVTLTLSKLYLKYPWKHFEVTNMEVMAYPSLWDGTTAWQRKCFRDLNKLKRSEGLEVSYLNFHLRKLQRKELNKLRKVKEKE